MILNELTHSELMVMKSVWDMGDEVSLSEIVEHVNAQFEKDWKPQTVSTFLTKLVKKNYLQLERKGKSWVYRILISAEQYQEYEMTGFFRFWGRGSVGRTLTALLREEEIEKDEIAKLRSLLDEMDDDTVL
ncbi:MAG: BlaI/MecI/CopY family transcriptional regulator [Clostridiales bacterium]|nr:BlaI/MecI/CopY family transcriptional regulator [Clostridiales bacterium]